MIELAEMIRKLRDELAVAVAAAKDEELQFALGPVELEASVVVERSGTAGAKVRFWVVDGGGEGRIASGSAHRITLTLHPQERGSGGQPWVSGSAELGER
ncbi:trypco2 family protein [Streptomyces sp. MUM 178J]|uniref:trypco2 family protein n=1 Tax=Streptomyces sp. MUM 178J TaxID=2791991 RepID=UPI001F0344EC|nr:trypco2 family protein [Streptomyces sp. MUM 178J]WRQ78027.1 trypco2 family protein [Streptomyces sp. MUM 178J]